MQPKKLSKEEFIGIYTKVPRLTIDLILKYPEGVVLTKRAINPWKGKWHFPGGTILLGETIEQAAKRIAKDELGLKIEITDFLGPIEFYMPDKGYSHTVSLELLVRSDSKDIKLNYQASKYIITKNPPEEAIKEHAEFLIKNIDKIGFS